MLQLCFNLTKSNNILGWRKNDELEKCFKCRRSFSILFRRHECKRCREIFCSICSSHFIHYRNYIHMPQWFNWVTGFSSHRTCDSCFDQLTSEDLIANKQNWPFSNSILTLLPPPNLTYDLPNKKISKICTSHDASTSEFLGGTREQVIVTLDRSKKVPILYGISSAPIDGKYRETIDLQELPICDSASFTSFYKNKVMRGYRLNKNIMENRLDGKTNEDIKKTAKAERNVPNSKSAGEKKTVKAEKKTAKAEKKTAKAEKNVPNLKSAGEKKTAKEQQQHDLERVESEKTGSEVRRQEFSNQNVYEADLSVKDHCSSNPSFTEASFSSDSSVGDENPFVEETLADRDHTEQCSLDQSSSNESSTDESSETSSMNEYSIFQPFNNIIVSETNQTDEPIIDRNRARQQTLQSIIEGTGENNITRQSTREVPFLARYSTKTTLSSTDSSYGRSESTEYLHDKLTEDTNALAKSSAIRYPTERFASDRTIEGKSYSEKPTSNRPISSPMEMSLFNHCYIGTSSTNNSDEKLMKDDFSMTKPLRGGNNAKDHFFSSRLPVDKQSVASPRLIDDHIRLNEKMPESVINPSNPFKKTSEDNNICPICTKDLKKFSEEESASHIKNCLHQAAIFQQHNKNYNPERTTTKSRILVYVISKDCHNNNGEFPECPICFEYMEEGQEVGRLECLCVFHTHCIRSWLLKRTQRLRSYHTNRSTKNFCPLHDAILG